MSNPFTSKTRSENNPFLSAKTKSENNPFLSTTTARTDYSSLQEGSSSKLFKEGSSSKLKEGSSSKLFKEGSKLLSKPENNPKFDNAKFSKENKFASKSDNQDEIYEPEQDVDYIRHKVDYLQRDDLERTRNLVKTLTTTRSVGESTLNNLSTQQEQLDKIEKETLETRHHVAIANEHVKDIKKYSNLIAFSWPKIFSSKKRQEQKTLKETEEDLVQIRKQGYKEKNDPRLKAKEDLSRMSSSSTVAGGTIMGEEFRSNELEIEKNLDSISSHLGSLKMMGLAMQETIGKQNEQIGRIQTKAEDTDAAMCRTINSMKKLK